MIVGIEHSNRMPVGLRNVMRRCVTSVAVAKTNFHALEIVAGGQMLFEGPEIEPDKYRGRRTAFWLTRLPANFRDSHPGPNKSRISQKSGDFSDYSATAIAGARSAK